MILKLAISDIGWHEKQDTVVYKIMQRYSFTGLEIAPTRILPDRPYDRLKEIGTWAEGVKRDWGFDIISMQSIWFGRQENLFGSAEERMSLIDYTKKAIDFAATIGCKNLVFGCPRNRMLPKGADPGTGITFFKEIGNFAAEKGTAIGMEANPPIYNTNYINDTASALELIRKVNSKGFLLNLDVGTMIQNDESIDELRRSVALINHVHISEPGLKLIVKRKMHKQLRNLLFEENYQGFISIEMGRTDKLQNIEDALAYVKEIFGS